VHLKTPPEATSLPKQRILLEESNAVLKALLTDR
jgi:hypothetical protein